MSPVRCQGRLASILSSASRQAPDAQGAAAGTASKKQESAVLRWGRSAAHSFAVYRTLLRRERLGMTRNPADVGERMLVLTQSI